MTRGARLPGIGSHHSAVRISDEWYTPPEIVRALPEFDLDPCAPPGGPTSWARVARWYDQEQDGLSMPWEGHVWLNPPYSDVEPWMRKMAEHGDGVALIFARAETSWWFESIWPHATEILFLRGRVTFWRPGEEGLEPSRAGANSGGPSALVAYGSWAASAVGGCGLSGASVTIEEVR